MNERALPFAAILATLPATLATLPTTLATLPATLATLPATLNPPHVILNSVKDLSSVASTPLRLRSA